MRYKSAYESIDELHDQYVEAKSVHLDCGRKCFWCCYLRVDATAHEILAIASHIEKKFTPRELERLIKRLAEHAERVRPLTYSQHMSTNIVCPLLIDGCCSVYSLRPFGCRRHHSQRVQA